MKTPNRISTWLHRVVAIAVAALAMTWAAAVPAAQSTGAVVGSSTSYTCDSVEGKCKCSGWFDCKKLQDSGNCKGTIGVCSRPASGGKEVCQCDWKNAVRSGGKVRPGTAAPANQLRR